METQDPQRPVFGEFMQLIHPFDFYELSANENHVKQVGVTGIPVQMEDGRCYLSSAGIHRIQDQLYCVTTTVPAKTKNIV